MGTMNHFRIVNTTAASNKELLMKKIRSSKLIIGCVATPVFDDWSLDLVLACTDLVDGLMFTGSAMTTGKGLKLLDADGSYSFLVS